jgi:hypothetical protein
MEWQTMDTAPMDGSIIEGINRSMQMPVDMCWGEYRLIIGDIVNRVETGWHVPHHFNGRIPTIFPSFWRPKTTGDKLTMQRFDALVEWPPLPAKEAA